MNGAMEMTMPDGQTGQARVDICIAGGGLVGLTAALALHQACGDACRIILCDPAPPPAAPTVRAYAVAAAGRQFLDALGLWAAIAADAQPVRDMVISDSRLHDPVRQPILTFGEATAGAPLAHLVDESALVARARAAVAAAGIPIRQAAVTGFAPRPGRLALTLSDGTGLGTALLVAADGGRSRCRDIAGIGTVGWDYGQTGLVALLGHTEDHHGKAYQHFLPAGPFAILPMTGQRSSIVWNESARDADAILAMDAEDQMRELEQRLGGFLGRLSFLTPLRGYPLRFQLSRKFAGERLALVGDAAHIVHPIAGQGLNLGLLDAQALARRVGDAVRLGLDPGDPTALAAYERDRRFDTVLKGFSMDQLNRLFSNDLTPVRLMRDLGLGLVDRLPRLKRAFARLAAGVPGDARPQP